VLMEFPERYKKFIKSLEARIHLEGFRDDDFTDITTNELIFSEQLIKQINIDNRTHESIWSINQSTPSFWPDDHLIIGGSGSGNYYFISASNAFDEIMFFDHEVCETYIFAATLDEYYEKVMSIMRERKNAYIERN
jgi:hypothetical protein